MGSSPAATVTTSPRNQKDRHEICRFDVETVICSICGTEQAVIQEEFGLHWLSYRLRKDSATAVIAASAAELVVERTSIARNVDPATNVHLFNKHSCVENSMRHHCSICYEYLFDSMKETTVMKCGHTMHTECLHEMLLHEKYRCPICSKALINMTKVWRQLDEEIEETEMPEDYRSRKMLSKQYLSWTLGKQQAFLCHLDHQTSFSCAWILGMFDTNETIFAVPLQRLQ